jgi:hypothetical protein
MADPSLWFPGARLNQLAPVDGGSILGGKPKTLHHDTETAGFPSYSSGFWPNMTINPATGEVRQHIPANRAGRALRNETGGVQTNRFNVFQIEWIGFANKVPFHPVGAEVAAWLHDVRGCPRTESVDWLAYPSSFGQTSVRLSAAEWSDYAGHLAHMHCPENDHGDPGWPFPIAQILEGDMTVDELRDEFTAGGDSTVRGAVLELAKRALVEELTTGGSQTRTAIRELAALGVADKTADITAAVVAALPAGSVDAAVVQAAVETALNATVLQVTPA